MAVIKDGNGSTDQLKITNQKAALVQLIDSSGNEVSHDIIVDDNNTTDTPLSAGSSFIGTATDISKYQQLNISIFGRPGVVAGDGSSAKASFFFEFSKDGSNWDISVPHLIRDPSLVIPIPVINVHKYFRLKYLNDGGVSAIAALGLMDTAGTPTNQTEFRLTTYLLPLGTKELTRTMDQGISGSDPCQLVRAGIMGKNPEDQYVNLPATGHDNKNRTTAALTNGSTWVGDWEETIGYSSIIVNIFSDRAGKLTVEFSDTAFTVTQSVTRNYNIANLGAVFSFVPASHHYRLKFINDSGANNTFTNIHSNLQANGLGPIYTSADTPVSPRSASQLVVAVPTDGAKTTYSVASLGVGPALAPTDIFTITGSATKTIRINKISISGTKTTAGQIDIVLLKRSTANTGGVAVAQSIVPHDSNNPSATAVANVYTSNPAVLGTLVGNIIVDKLFLPATGTATDGGTKSYEFSIRAGQSIVLRGVNEVFALNLNAVSATGGSFNITCEFTEE